MAGAQILVLEGDGIGPEITAATLSVLRAAARASDSRLHSAVPRSAWRRIAKHGTTFPDAVFEQAQDGGWRHARPGSHNDYPPREQGGLNPSGELRKRLDLYANIRPARSRAAFRRAAAAASIW